MNETITYEQAFNQIADQMKALYSKKNQDYGNSFASTWKRLGPISGLTRMSDKFNRLCNLMTSKVAPSVEDESIEDTLVDLACYSIMSLIEMQNAKGKITIK